MRMDQKWQYIHTVHTEIYLHDNYFTTKFDKHITSINKNNALHLSEKK